MAVGPLPSALTSGERRVVSVVLLGEARRVLRAASVFGEVFWQGSVAELLGSTLQPRR